MPSGRHKDVWLQNIYFLDKLAAVLRIFAIRTYCIRSDLDRVAKVKGREGEGRVW